MTDIEKFHKLIAKARNILITSHYRPDQDAICSTLALKYYLGKRYEDKKITVGFTGDKIHEMDYISGIEEINWYKDIADVVNKFDKHLEPCQLYS
jgi:nanoRNase/pAp phosphatase (c-di-AMP/oligoRNAs hydrolase)